MRVGILTYHDLNNFGAQLQATATQRFLAQHGIDAELVDFRPVRRLVRYASPIVRALATGKFAEMAYQSNKRQRFRNSLLKNAGVGKPPLYFDAQVERHCRKYDVLICGSDELWNFADYLGYSPSYILDFGPEVKARRISYAASLGSYEPAGDIGGRMAASLRKFSAIMVRDANTKAAVEGFGLKADLVLDPTFLTDLPVVAAPAKRYLMLSGGMPKALVELGVATAEKMGVEPISVGYAYKGFEKIAVDATPPEWLGYVQGAVGLVTTLFHGCALSIKHDVPFAAMVPASKAGKMGALLETFGCKARALSPDSSPDQVAALLSSPLGSEVGARRDELAGRSRERLLRAVGA